MLLYIMGRGHSGSTALDLILTAEFNGFGCGELVSGLGRWPAGQCACGSVFEACEFWQNVSATYELNSAKSLRSDAAEFYSYFKLKNYFKLLFRVESKALIEELQAIDSGLSAAISAASDVSVTVESSKELTRALFLMKSRREVVILHLIKSPFLVFESNYKRYKRGDPLKFNGTVYMYSKWKFPAFALLIAVGWNVSLILGGILRLVKPSKYMMITNEELTSNLHSTLSKIGQRIEKPPGLVSEGLTKISTGHRIGGNKILRNEFVDVKFTDNDNTLPFGYRLFVAVINGPLWISVKPWQQPDSNKRAETRKANNSDLP